MACLDDAEATIHVHHSPVPEVTLGAVPSGTHVLVMTHDHAEDFALCDAALRCEHLGSIGLIGSAAKWTRFRAGLSGGGPRRGDDRAASAPRSGSPEPSGKEPAAIALSVATSLLLGTQVAAGNSQR